MKVQQNRLSIAVVGAGLMGRLTALQLHRAGHEVTLLDKDSQTGKQSTAYAAAGLLTPLGESLKAEANIVAMGCVSMALWPKLLATLDEHVYFQQQGSLMVSHEQDKGDFVRQLRHLQNNYADHELQLLDRQGIEALEPELGRSFHQALYLPEEGQIGNRRLLIALQKQLNSEGVNWLTGCEVTAIIGGSNQAKIRYQQQAQQKSLNVNLVVDCRGTGAISKNQQADFQGLDDLRAVRGELFQLFAPQVTLTRPIRLMHPRYQLYIAPKSKGFYVVGATEIESDDMSPMTVRSAMELLSAAYSVHPGFAEANIRQHVSHCRPAFSDNQPRIRCQSRLIQVNGLFRHGFLIAPVVLEQVEQMVAAYANNIAEPSSSYRHLIKVEHYEHLY